MSADIFQDLLLPDEKIQWVARPQVTYFRDPSSVFIGLFAVSLILFGLFHLFNRIIAILNFEYAIPWILFGLQGYDILSIGMLIVGIIVLSTQVGRVRRLSNTCYALSDKRAFFSIGPSDRMDRFSCNISSGGILAIGMKRSKYRLAFSGNFGSEEERNTFAFEYLGVNDFETALPIVKNIIGVAKP